MGLAILLLVLGAIWAPTDPPRSFADFVPSRDGFAFVNAFSGSPLPGPLSLVPSPTGTSFGLCGGMSAAAADLFLARRGAPAVSTPPGKADPLYHYLWSRQLDSLGKDLGIAARFADWMRAPPLGPDGLPRRTALELPAILADLDRGTPVVLGLVFVRAGQGAIWDNHQVLAFASRRTLPNVVELRVYDPNFPRHDGVVVRSVLGITGTWLVATPIPTPVVLIGASVVLRVPADAAHGHRARRDKLVHGFFQVPYEPQALPDFEAR